MKVCSLLHCVILTTLTVAAAMCADSLSVITGFHVGRSYRQRSNEATAAAHSKPSLFNLTAAHPSVIMLHIIHQITQDDIIMNKMTRDYQTHDYY